jgi:ESCRT-II complex subunit VPS36
MTSAPKPARFTKQNKKENQPIENVSANNKNNAASIDEADHKKAMDHVFTPFDCLAVAETTRSGLLMCWKAEIEVCWVSNGELRCCTNSTNGEPPMVPLTRNNIDGTAVVDTTKTKWIDRCADLDILVTTHRLAFVKTGSSSTNEPPQQPKHPPGGGGGGERIIRYIHHSNIFSLTTESSLFKSPKLILQCSIGELILAFPNGSDRTKRRDECHDQLKMALQRQQWETTTSGGSHAPPTSGRRRVGVDAILTANTRRHQQAAQLTSTAFGGDAEQLLREAADLVQIIQKYVATLDRNSSNNNNPDDDGDGGGGGGGAADNQQLVQMMQGMGMTSALHRDDQLARQLADFLRPKFQHHPVITLTDVYCWFNRARGFSHLLSPDELLTAITSMEALRLGISRQTFESGLVVLRSDDDDPQQGGSSNHEAVLHRRFLDLCAEQSRALPNPHAGCVTAVQVAQATQVPAVLALEQLQWAERQGVLVRDETVESIRFYPNRFNDW